MTPSSELSRQQTSVVRSAFLTVTMRWTDRLIGFVSTLILARLLVPADFGIVAMGSLVIALADVLLDLGVHIALIRNPHATQAHYDTAWTIRLMQSGFAAALVVLAAPLAAQYFNEPRVTLVIQVMALSFLLQGFENVGVIAFQKEMRFGQDFRFLFAKRMAGFIATVTAAWLLQSYWAMVIGALVGRAFGVLLSYRMHPMRPRLTLEKFGEIFAISQWVLVESIGTYLQGRLHQFVVGGRENAAVLGEYTLAGEISNMPTTELLAPLNRVLFPTFARAKDNLAELKRLFLLAQGVQTLVAMPAAIGLMLVAPELVRVLLGEKWVGVTPFIQIFAFFGFLRAITTSGSYVLMTLGKVRVLAAMSWVMVGLFAVSVFAVFPEAGAYGIAWLRLALTAVGFAIFVGLLLHQMQDLTLREVLTSVVRPVIAVVAMSACVHAAAVAALPPVALLAVKIVVGAVAYGLAILLLWQLAGRPAGAESYLLGKLAEARRRGGDRRGP